LADGKVGEDFDLDFKSNVYANGDKGKRDLAVDVAALANTAGGLIVVGMSEDDQARALAPTKMPVNDSEINRMLQIIAAGVAPFPAVDIRISEDPDQPGTGFILVSVPRSPIAPHAVLVNESLRFPRRNGRTTTYLSEPDVAHAYRERFAGLQSRLDAAAEHEAYLIDRLSPDQQSYVVVTLVPDLDGHLDVDLRSFRAFQTEMLEQDPLIVYSGSTWKRTSVAAGRLIADGGYGTADSRMSWLGCALHRTGAGSFAAAVENRGDGQEIAKVSDERLVSAVMSGLRFLARHARDRAAAAGSASLRATITPVTEQVPTCLIHDRHFGAEQHVGTTAIRTPPLATALADVDDLAEGGASLLAATHSLVSGLMQEFGHPEALQTTPDGDLRVRYWKSEVHAHLRRWAEENGVTVSDNTAS
jgi:hypothetical protein